MLYRAIDMWECVGILTFLLLLLFFILISLHFLFGEGKCEKLNDTKINNMSYSY